LPFWAATQEAARDFFHPENMALAFALLAAWAGIRCHRVAMWALCVLTLTCKEDQIYTVGVLSVVMRVHGAPEIKRHWRFILYLAGAWFLIATGIVQQQFHHFGYTDFVSYRWLVGLDPNMPVSPLAVAQELGRPDALAMLAAIVASMFALPLLAPRWLLLGVRPLSSRPVRRREPVRQTQLSRAAPGCDDGDPLGCAGERRRRFDRLARQPAHDQRLPGHARRIELRRDRSEHVPGRHHEQG